MVYNFLFMSGHLRKSWIDVYEQVISKRRQARKEKGGGGGGFETEGMKRQI